MKKYIKKDPKDPHKCIEPCPIVNDENKKDMWESIGVMIGSGYCQSCEHHKCNDKSGVNPYSSVSWIECDKLTDF